MLPSGPTSHDPAPVGSQSTSPLNGYPSDRMALFCTAGTGLFFGLMFAIRSGYSYGAALLFMLGLYYALAPSCRMHHSAYPLSRQDHTVAWALLAYFLVALATTAGLGNDYYHLDQPLRAALAVPVLLMLVRVAYDLRFFWAGVVTGLALSVGVAWWQLHVLGYDRAEGFLNIIHFGNIALVFGAFCAAGLHWAGALQGPRRPLWFAALTFGIACSGYSIVASGSRGSWVALPILVALYAIAFLNRRNLTYAIGGAGAIAIAAIVMFNMPDSKLRERYDAAITDIQLFQQGHADTSLGARFVMWEGALRNIPERIWTGWNHAEYDARIAEQVARGELNPVALKFTDNLHNSYLHALAFQGIAGLLALLAIYLVPLAGFVGRLRHDDIAVRSLAYCGAALCSSYVFFSLTQVILRRNNGIMFYVIALAILWGGMRLRERHALRGSRA